MGIRDFIFFDFHVVIHSFYSWQDCNYILTNVESRVFSGNRYKVAQGDRQRAGPFVNMACTLILSQIFATMKRVPYG
jgi:hypothetical protein